MILNVIKAEYKEGYRIYLYFNNGESGLVDLQKIIFSDHRKIFVPLREIEYFKKFKIHLNTIVWPNEADFAPEFLYELCQIQAGKQNINA
jgi:hypothetical protein